MNVLDHEKLHQKYFEELSRIPRASFKEERVSDYLEDFARTRGLDYKRDTIGNVVIYKPASAGYEDHGAVILQAHTDMVCEKNAIFARIKFLGNLVSFSSNNTGHRTY